MAHYYIYAKDCSGSTEGFNYYDNNGLDTIKEFESEVKRIKNEQLIAGEKPPESRIIYLHSGHVCYKVDDSTIVRSYKKLSRKNSYLNLIMRRKFSDNCISEKNVPDDSQYSIVDTGIHTLITQVCGDINKVKLLYIVTDGSLDAASAENCFELNENIQCEKVVFYAFNKNLDLIDLSLAAPFFKSHCMVYRNNELIDDIDISQEFAYEKITVDNFATEIKSLRSYIKLKFIRTSKQDALALQEIEKLKKLKERLIGELLSKSQKRSVNLETKDRNVFLREFFSTDWYTGLNALDKDEKSDIKKSISTLINYIVSDRKSYSFDALKLETKFGNVFKKEPFVDVNFPTEQKIEFPSIIQDYDKEITVIIPTPFNLLDKIIFHETKESIQAVPASFSKFESAIKCPLFLMEDQDVGELIIFPCIWNTYKQLLEKTKIDPTKKNPFMGGLVLTDTDLFDKYNDYVLSLTYFDSKKVDFNVGLFYFILWKKCENKEDINENVKEQFKKYVMRRISMTVCKIGLSSSPQDPQEDVSLPTALWYCVELSSCIFKDDPRNFMQERMRTFYPVVHWMIEILQYFNYDLDLESIEKRRELIRYVMILKDIPTRREQVYYLLEEIFKKVNGFLVSEIEKPFNLKKLNYLKFNHKGMLRDDVMEKKVNLNDYIYLANYVGDLGESEDGNCMFKLRRSAHSFFLTVEENESFCTELAKATRKIVINNADDEDKINITYEPLDSVEFDDILCRYNLFIDCVRHFGKYPTLPEYIEYISTTNKFICEMVNIFPPNIINEVEDVYSRYQSIVINFDANEFVKVCTDCINRSAGIKCEKLLEKIEQFLQQK